jgi:predicted phosphohydrolase
MRFQYISDIHLEFGNNINIIPVADYLILAGDIGDPCKLEYINFLDDVSQKFKKVFMITGNHEYYSKNHSMEKIESIIRNHCLNYTNVYYLQNQIYHFRDYNISIFGSTMWSFIEPEEENNVKKYMNDYKYIPNFTIEKSNSLYKESLFILESIINSVENRNWIVILHHMPKKSLINPIYITSPINSAFASDILCLSNQDHVVAVVYGHTHKPSVNGKYYCNPVGYPEENKNINLEAFFEVKEE